MKKPSSLAEQVRQAQNELSGWSETKRSTLHLEGTDVFLARLESRHEPQRSKVTLIAPRQRAKVSA